MDVQNAAQVDYLAFFSTELPKQLAEMAALRDELQQRQGAMSAVVEANNLRQQAVDVLTKAQTDAATMKQDAERALSEAMAAKAQAEADAAGEKATLQSLLEEVNGKLRQLAEDKLAFDADTKKRKDAADKRDRELSARASELAAQQDAMAQDRTNLEMRIKKFSEAIGAL